MNTYKLYNDVEIPQLGYGTWQLPETYDCVRQALDIGYCHIDTARSYQNEAAIGQAIQDSGIDRKDIFLTTKLSIQDINRVPDAFQESLDNLQTDYIDLYLLHWPVQGYIQAWKEMEKIYESGRVRAIGLSNFTVSKLQAVRLVQTYEPMVHQVESNPYFKNEEIIQTSRNRNMAIEVYRPLGGRREVDQILTEDILVELSQKYHKTPAQVLLRWNIQRDCIVFPKTTNINHMKENFNIFDFQLLDEDMERISQLKSKSYVTNLMPE